MPFDRPTRDTTRSEENLATYVTVARRILQSGQAIVGLLPVPLSARFEAVPRHLAKVLASLGGTVGLVAPREAWFDDQSKGQVVVSSLAESVDSITPVWPSRRITGATIEETLAILDGRYGVVLLNLAGFEPAEVHEIALLPGVAIVFLIAQGKASELTLSKVRRAIPAERQMGAVLVELQRNGAPGQATRTK